MTFLQMTWMKSGTWLSAHAPKLSVTQATWCDQPTLSS